MKKHPLLAVALCVALSMTRLPAAAQYYSWGADAPMRWSTLRSDRLQVIVPDTALLPGREALFIAGRIRHDIGYGFTHGPMRVPFVLHPENFEANGMVMYLPKRVELRTIPETEGFAVPWMKHLVAHEYRHAVQYNNLNRGVFRVLRILAGQQSPMVSLLCMPLWGLEGDAVIAETQRFAFGRGLQPSFSIGYRAMQRVGTDASGQRYRRNPDKWFCGSFREYIPDHYQLGYQLNSYAYDRYGEVIWDKIVARAVRRPYYFATTRLGLKKYYGTTVPQLFRDTFDELQGLWDALPDEPDSAEPLVELSDRNYTTYRWPQPADATTLLVVKEDYDRPARFVLLDTATGDERTIARTGIFSTRPVLRDGRVWWTEYRRSKLFPERVNSQLCWMDLAEGRPHTVDSLRNALYPTPEADGLAWVEHTPDGIYAIVDSRGGRMALPFGTEVHGLAWDDATDALYALLTEDAGMRIVRIGDGGLQAVTPATYATISDLRSDNRGGLYFGSIASGKDEAYRLDLLEAAAEPVRLTTSRYGSFAPAPMPGGETAVVTVYDRRGYRPALQPLDSLRPTPWSQLPANVVNPERPRWPILQLDTVSFAASEQEAQEQAVPARRYRKALHAIHVHSWLPAALDPFEAVDDHRVDLNLGATLLSQNLLSNTEVFASYGWNRDEGSLVRAGLRYTGWGVQLAFGATYGGNQMLYRLSTPNPDYDASDPDARKVLYQPLPDLAKHYALEASASLPLLFQRGYHTRQLTLSAHWNFSNGRVADLSAIERDAEGRITNIDRIGYNNGLHKLQFGVSFSDQVRMAYRDLAPRFAWQLMVNYALNPTNRDFSQFVSLYGHLYLPGFAAHHSLKIAANYQTSVGGARFAPGYRPLSYRSSVLLPHGFASSAIASDHYRAASLDYQLPLACPDGGIRGLLYFKRIRLNLGAQAAQFRTPGPRRMMQQRIWAAGGDLIFDVNLLRLPASGTTSIKLSAYYPSSGKLWIGGSVGLPF